MARQDGENKDEQRVKFGSGPRKTTVYRNGKLVKDEPKAALAKAAAKAKAPAKVATKAPAPVVRPKEKPMTTSKVPMTREKRARIKEAVKGARAIIDTTSPARSTKGKVKTDVSYEDWKKMSRAERKAQGLPETTLGVQTWGLKKGVMN